MGPVSEEAADQSVRTRAFPFLARLSQIHPNGIPWSVLLAGFDFEGRRVPLASQQGIFIWGADDPTFPEPRAREMVPQFPNVAGFHSIARAKLFVYEEHPQEVARLIDRFLAAPPR